MAIQALFPTLVYRARLQGKTNPALNRELLRETHQIKAADAAGRKWSAGRYPGGYTSYGSLCQLHRMSSTFSTLEKKLRRHVKRFAERLDFDLEDRTLAMTDCWVNVMSRQVVHGLHLHPLATISGTYYVRTPRGCSGLKLEDPRLDRFMAAPPRKGNGGLERQTWVTIPAVAGEVVLFESWLRHEVPRMKPAVKRDRVSVSFNYDWV